ncbi:protein kilB [Streptomyces sp. NPDC003444]
MVAGLIQHRTTRSARNAERVDRRRDQALEAVTALASALAAHRRAQFVREELRLAGVDEARLDAARAELHTARAAIETPRVLVAILAPALAPAADAATQASCALRDAPDTLNALRQDAISATKAFVAAARHFV